MTATTAALVPIQPALTDAERFALAVATLPGDSPAQSRGSVGIRRGGAGSLAMPGNWLATAEAPTCCRRDH